ETGGPAVTGTQGPTGATGRPPEPIAQIGNARFFGVFPVDPERYSRDLTRLSQEILQHLAADPDTELEVTVEIRAHRPQGFPDDKVRVITENASVLKFKPFRFDPD